MPYPFTLAVLISALLAGLANAAPTTSQNGRQLYRFDTTDIFDPLASYNLVPIQTKEIVHEANLVTGTGGEAAKINVVFTCEADDTIKCEKARKGYEKAAEIVAKELNLKTNITLSAKFKPFCDPDGCNLNLLGTARPASYWNGIYDGREKLKGGNYMYPQALVKQFNRASEVEWNEVDIIAEFNSEQQFWFPGDSAIRKGQYDFLMVVCHEITHGLGFLSSWNTYLGTGYLTPRPDVNLTESKFYGWNAQNVFDAFLETNQNKDLTQYGNQITSFTTDEKEGEDFSDWKSKFYASNAPAKSAQEVYNLAVSQEPALEMKLPTSKDDMVLHVVRGSFKPGTSLTHFSVKFYSNTSDFLMRPSIDSGKNLQTYIDKYGSIYGPGTKGILYAMGWDIDGYNKVMGNFRFTDTLTLTRESPSSAHRATYLGFIGSMLTATVSMLLL